MASYRVDRRAAARRQRRSGSSVAAGGSRPLPAPFMTRPRRHCSTRRNPIRHHWDRIEFSSRAGTRSIDRPTSGRLIGSVTAVGDRSMTPATAARNYQVLDQFLDPIRDILTPEVAHAIADLRASPAIQARIEDFAGRHHEGKLSPEERASPSRNSTMSHSRPRSPWDRRGRTPATLPRISGSYHPIDP
jgi:hypothetical protein